MVQGDPVIGRAARRSWRILGCRGIFCHLHPILCHVGIPGISRIRLHGIRLETDAAAPDAFLTVDGQEGIPLCGGDVIRVQSLDAGLRVLSCSSGTYFQRLRERGFIQTDGTSAPEHV